MVAIIIGLVFARDCGAQQTSQSPVKKEISFQSGKQTFTYSGCFKDSCAVDAGQNIMLCKMEEPLDEYKGEKNFRRFFFWYRLTGRTGEKAFSIESGMDWISQRDGNPNLGSGDKVKLQNLYFSAGDTVPLARSFYSGCSDASDQMIKLKMIELKGNSLIHQLILPDCMKDIRTN
jgi:hypothetical protein